jgi:hypothetical protein
MLALAMKPSLLLAPLYALELGDPFSGYFLE